MDIIIKPGILQGEIPIIPSKSIAHRALICAAFSDKPTKIFCPETGADIDATADCLAALGAEILRTDSGFNVFPISFPPKRATLSCRESGSTLRFLLPIVGALGIDTTFVMEGRLPQRPLSPLWEEMERMGCSLSRPTFNTIRCAGKLQRGAYTIAGSVSSQFITGLLFAQALVGECSLQIMDPPQSQPYIDMTLDVLRRFHAPALQSPGYFTVEGDWSSAAFWLTANALGSDIQVLGLTQDSLQGDRAVSKFLHQLEQACPTISAKDTPDLIPVLAVAAAAKHGVVFTDIQRLRLKESDRVASTIAMIEALGGMAEATENTLTIQATGLIGGVVDACADHRIAMAAAVASTVCTDPVTILSADCVKKSYPGFWDDFTRLGGKYELYLR